MNDKVTGDLLRRLVALERGPLRKMREEEAVAAVAEAESFAAAEDLEGAEKAVGKALSLLGVHWAALSPPPGLRDVILPPEERIPAVSPADFPGDELFPWAYDEDRGKVLGVPYEDISMTWSAGVAGQGGTSTAVARFLSVVKSGRGGLFLDVDGRASENVRSHLGGDADRLTEISVHPEDPLPATGYNPFDVHPAEAEEAAAVTAEALAEAVGRNENSLRGLPKLYALTRSAASLAAVAPPGALPTVFTLTEPLRDRAWREGMTPHVSEREREWWESVGPYAAEGALGDLHALLGDMESRPAVRMLLGSGDDLKLAERIKNSEIVLVRLGSGSDRIDSFLASLLVGALPRAARASGGGSFHVFIDGDPARYGTALGEMMNASLEECLRSGLRIHVSSGGRSRFPDWEVPDSLLVNSSCVMSASLRKEDALAMSTGWNGGASAEAIRELPVRRFAHKVTIDGRETNVFYAEGLHPGLLFSNNGIALRAAPPLPDKAAEARDNLRSFLTASA